MGEKRENQSLHVTCLRLTIHTQYIHIYWYINIYIIQYTFGLTDTNPRNSLWVTAKEARNYKGCQLYQIIIFSNQEKWQKLHKFIVIVFLEIIKIIVRKFLVLFERKKNIKKFVVYMAILHYDCLVYFVSWESQGVERSEYSLRISCDLYLFSLSYIYILYLL